MLGVMATGHAMSEEAWRKSSVPLLAFVAAKLESNLDARMIAGAILLTMLVHVVETSKFVWTWMGYKAAVRMLATGTDTDPTLGDPQFVSSLRIDAGLNRLAWNSTTPYLAVLMAPGLNPTRLVVDPSAGYFWLSCKTARRSERHSIAISAEGRRLVRLHACLHR
jgi:hypothetical protein